VFATDFVICATGIDMNFAGRPELQNCAANIVVWADRYQPPMDERSPRLGRFPYLGDDYALMERVAGDTPWIVDIHVFAIASTMSFGPSGSSINAMTTAVPKLVHGLTRGLFRTDIERHWASFRAYDVPQAMVDGRRRPSARSGERCSVRSWNGWLIPIMLGITAKPGWHIPCFKLMFSFRK
jgi:FAD-dependent urate hydroxylase